MPEDLAAIHAEPVEAQLARTMPETKCATAPEDVEPEESPA